MVDPVTLARAAAALLSNEKTRKALGWVLVAILSPVIVLVGLLCGLGSGMAQHNASTVSLCFSDAPLLVTMPAEYSAAVTSMRQCFALLDGSIAEITAMIEDEGCSLDDVRVKAVFMALYFGEADPAAFSARSFANCFVRYEERTRLVEAEEDPDAEEDGEDPEGGDEGGDASSDADSADPGTEDPDAEDVPAEPVMIEETYLVAVPLDDLAEVYANLAALRGTPATDEQMGNAESIYALAKYGYLSYGEFEGADVPFIGADGFCSPIGEQWRSVVASEFGTRTDPLNGKTSTHTGIDLSVPNGTPVRAALPGTVTVAQYSTGSYGYYVQIDHGDGLSTLYAHNSQLLVQAGQTVEAGDVIALSGATGRVTGPHVHFEVHINGTRTNPRSYLP